MSLKSIHKLEIWKANTLYSLNSGLLTKPELKSGQQAGKSGIYKVLKPVCF